MDDDAQAAAQPAPQDVGAAQPQAPQAPGQSQAPQAPQSPGQPEGDVAAGPPTDAGATPPVAGIDAGAAPTSPVVTAQTTPSGTEADNFSYVDVYGAVEEPDDTSGGPPLFDFRRPSKLSRDHVRALRIVQEQLARRLATVFAGEVRVVPSIEPAQVGQMTFDDFVKEAQENAYFALFTVEPLPDTAILYLPRGITMTMLDRMLGGAGQGDQPNRPLSEIEMVLCRGIATGVLREFAAAMESIVEVEPAIVGEEANLLLAPVMPPSEMCVLVPFTIAIAGHVEDITMCFPFATILPSLEARDINAGNTTRRADRVAAARDIAQRMDDVTIPVSVTFDPVRAPADGIRNLEVGDVIELRHLTSTPLTARVGNHKTFSVVPGRKGRRLAVRVLGPHDPSRR